MASFRASLRVAQPMRAGLRATKSPAVARIAAPSARFYASGPTPGSHPPPSDSANKGTSKMLFASVALLAAGAGAFLFLGDDKKSTLGVGKGTDTSKVSGAKARVAKSAGLAGDGSGLGTSFEDYQEVYNAIAEKLDNEDYDDGSYGPVLVRLAWHASGTYDKKSGTGGSNGATMRFAPESDHGANAGLIHARNFMDDIRKQFPWISYSDLWTLGGVVAVQELGGPKIKWRPGRSDKEAAHCAPDGRLPDGDKGSSHLRDIFYRMGFNDADIVALSGAHSLGRCHPDRSGFSGPWQHSPTSFNNEYFRLLIEEKWQPKKWDGPMQYEDVSTKSLMMLPTDMALVKDSKLKPYVEKFAKDEGAFFDAFAKVYSTLLELGVQETNWKAGLKVLPEGKPLVFKTLAEQEA